jgi:putative tryptophan/tyrosine transport system substrate-binding protein
LPVAQQRAPVPHVGILNYAADDDIRVRQFRDAIAGSGYVEGKNLTLTLHSADGVFDRLPGLAAELVAAKVDVIIALGPATWAARQATTSIPIIVAFSGDMVEMGVVASLARPGGNITGFSYMSGSLAAKRLELLSSAFSRSRRIGVLYNSREPATKGELASTEAAARTLKVALAPIAAHTPEELEAAFRTATAQQLDGFIVLTHGFAVLNGPRIIALAAQHRLPVLYGWRDFVAEGGLMSYGPDIEGLVRGAAHHVDRILKGASPADLPVEQPTRLIFTVNLKTAKALGLDLLPAILLRADEVIE